MSNAYQEDFPHRCLLVMIYSYRLRGLCHGLVLHKMGLSRFYFPQLAQKHVTNISVAENTIGNQVVTMI
jgi:hypothetical protein